jgi:hypothetical protein
MGEIDSKNVLNEFRPQFSFYNRVHSGILIILEKKGKENVYF